MFYAIYSFWSKKLLNSWWINLEKTEIAVRAYVKPTIEQEKNFPTLVEIPNFSRTITIDTETTVDHLQNLLFGYYRIDDDNAKVDDGIFYNPKQISKKELEILKKCSNKVIPVRKFVDDVFLPEVYDRQTLCIGLNLPFDLSRLAIDFGYGRKSNRGSFSFKLTENKRYPRLIIQNLDSTKSFIRFGTSTFSVHQYKGNFIDTRTLGFALSDRNLTLEGYCKFFSSPTKKHQSSEHGTITKKYVMYNQNDVNATYNLYLTLCKEYEKYNLSKPVTKIFSPASIGKSFLEEMGVLPFYQISEVSLQTLGLLMTTYYGGRTEVKIRKQPVRIKYLDFLSMYPTVCVLQKLWRFVIAKRIIEEDCTGWVTQFLEEINLKSLQNPQIWCQLPVIVCLKPDSDVLPARANYGNKYAYNIGINRISYQGELWYCLSDVIASKLLTGKSPEIIKAIRLVPIGIQEKLQPVTILNEFFDPKNQDFFKNIIEKRQELKEKHESQEHILKIIANSISYGIYAQINTQNRKSKVDVFGLNKFTTLVEKTEKLGERFNPILSTFITSGSRLVLAIVESILTSNNATHAFCDTDSMAVPAKLVKIIQKFFQKLNPYSFDKPLFKLEDENFVNGKEENLWFYGISSKRYVLYNIIDNKIIVRKHSSHGLGHIKNPFSYGIDWEKELWIDVLNYHYGKNSIDYINEKYSNHYAVSQLTLSTLYLLSRFRKLNQGKSFDKKIKPFNFCLVGFGNLESIKPLSPYRKNSQEVVFDEFLDYNSGQIMCGTSYWKDIRQIFWDYVNHQESKFNGESGILKRKNLHITNIVTVGKESNNLEESEILGLDENSVFEYQNTTLDIKKIFEMKPKDAKKIFGKNQYFRIKKAIKRGKFKPRKKTLEKLKISIT